MLIYVFFRFKTNQCLSFNDCAFILVLGVGVNSLFLSGKVENNADKQDMD
jgi:hypothetical protein